MTKRVETFFYTQDRKYGMLIDGECTQEEQGIRIDNLTSIRTDPWETMYE